MRLEFSPKEANDKKRYFFRAPPEITRGGPPPSLRENYSGFFSFKGGGYPQVPLICIAKNLVKEEREI